MATVLKFKHFGIMLTRDAVSTLSALAHPGRVEIFRLLVRCGRSGLPAGEIARTTGALPNTLSANLNVLSHAGLVTSRREGRSIIYYAAYGQMSELLAFLIEDCCGGDVDICGPLAEITERAACCAPSQLQRRPQLEDEKA